MIRVPLLYRGAGILLTVVVNGCAGGLSVDKATPTVEFIELLARLVAFLGAGVFFGYKALSGFHLINLSIDLEVSRETSPNRETDQLSVSAILSKGDTGTLVLDDAFVKVCAQDGTEVVTELQGLSRLDSKRLRRGEWVEATYSQLHLTPGESARFSCSATVAKNKVCHVEVVVLGHRLHHPWSRRSQWRASAVSLPSRREN